MFIVDGTQYDGVLTLARRAVIDEDENGGKALNGDVIRSVTGTRYEYELGIDSDGMTPALYDALYEALTAPADSHSVTMPYGQSTLSFTAYITSADDALERYDGDTPVWGGLKLRFYSTSVLRAPS